ncbi:response regulator [Paenibacillus sp. FSL H7-0737]|uniref:response regulator n=1 Tax=Paenibacillus sp. FSL H7-0737 TaxID=1536775 RepID=UPI0004F5FFD0|nr:response regulator [Paenibacillus sp. FSL H7-0737]AIQ22785.1 hypothetical protein H70737_07915 [Paenibacillus sp. FSL H7-0737]
MLKLLIVDDERIERSALRMIIERFLPEIRVVGEAENGRVAVELAEQLRPDVITMDIKMPGIDGTEAVSLIHNRFPAIRFIMMSAFDTFEYARKVMRYGVREYLLKPYRKDQIVEVIRTMSHEIAREKEDKQRTNELESKFKETLSLVESEWVSAILMDRIQEVQVRDWSHTLGVPESSGFAIVFVMSTKEKAWSVQERREIYSWLRHQCKISCFSLVGPMTGARIPVFMFPDAKSRLPIQHIHNTKDFVSNLAKFASRRFRSLQLSVGIGGLAASTDQLIGSYHEALLSASALNEGESSQTQEEWLSNSGMREAERRLLRSLGSGQFREMEEDFEFWVAELRLFCSDEIQDIKSGLHRLFTLADETLRESGLEPLPQLSFGEVEQVELLVEQAHSRLFLQARMLKHWYDNNSASAIRRAQTFISDHYRRELSLEETAEHVGLNPNYFSKIFSDRCGITFIDYLTGLRINKAKELLADPAQVLKEISIRIGYRDPNYFSRVFKKTTGMSPTEFRQSIGRL